MLGGVKGLTVLRYATCTAKIEEFFSTNYCLQGDCVLQPFKTSNFCKFLVCNFLAANFGGKKRKSVKLFEATFRWISKQVFKLEYFCDRKINFFFIILILRGKISFVESVPSFVSVSAADADADAMHRTFPGSRDEILEIQLHSSGDLKAVEAEKNEKKTEAERTRDFSKDESSEEKIKRRKIVFVKFVATMTTVAALAVSLLCLNGSLTITNLTVLRSYPGPFVEVVKSIAGVIEGSHSTQQPQV